MWIFSRKSKQKFIFKPFLTNWGKNEDQDEKIW